MLAYNGIKLGPKLLQLANMLEHDDHRAPAVMLADAVGKGLREMARARGIDPDAVGEDGEVGETVINAGKVPESRVKVGMGAPLGKGERKQA